MIAVVVSCFSLCFAIATATDHCSSSAKATEHCSTDVSLLQQGLQIQVEALPSSTFHHEVIDSSSDVPLISAANDSVEESHVEERRRLGKEMLEHQGTYDDVVDKYARRYHELLPLRSMIFFLHVSKSAGTLLCSAASANGCKTQNDACDAPFDAPYWIPTLSIVPRATPRSNTCAGLSADYAARHLTFTGNENYLIDEGLCSEFWNVMIFREPTSRLMSSLSMIASPDDVFHLDPSFNITTNSTPEQVFDRLPEISNNYFIRVLLGEDVYKLPFGSINSTHLEHAKRVLEGFDVVLVVVEDNKSFLEADISQTLGFALKEDEFGDFHPLGAGQSGARRQGATSEFQTELNWSSADWDSVNAANALDLELWQHAQDLNLMDRQVFRHPAFSKVSATMPHTPCGYLSK